MLTKKFKKNDITFVVFHLLPVVAIFAIFTAYPYISALRMSFYEWTGLSDVKNFIGLGNFRRLFIDPQLPKTIYANFYIMIAVPLFAFVLSMLYAVVITQAKVKEHGFYKVLFFMPYILPASIIAILWNSLFDYNYGLVNRVLAVLGIKTEFSLLGHPDTVLGALCVPMVWSVVGFYMILYITAINRVPLNLYESAIIDGASQVRQFFSITLPLIWDTIRVTIVLFILGAFNYSFSLPLIMFPMGTPGGRAEFIANYMWRVATSNQSYGYASAIGIFLFVISVSISGISLFSTRKESVEY